MRILMLTQFYPPEVGAAPIRLQAMVKQLIAAGHEVDVVTALPNYPAGKIFPGYRGRLWTKETIDAATVRRVWIHAATGSGRGRVFSMVSFAVLGVFGMFWSPKPDLVLVESPPLPATIPSLVYGLVRRRPMVLLLADLWPDTAVELGLLDRSSRLFRVLERLERTVYRRSWRISPVTHGQIDTLVHDKGVDRSRIAFLPNGVDTELFSPRTDPPPADEAPVILFAGALGYAQGLDVVLDASVIVRRRHPRTVFRFVGGGSDRERLGRRARDEQLDGVEFLEPVPVEEIAPMMRSCFAGITSLRASKVLEGARPSKVFTIMASGRPVVYSGTGEGADLVTGNAAGVVAPPEDSVALAAVIIELLDDPDAATEMGRRGRVFVERELAWSRLVAEWLAELGDVPGVGTTRESV